MDLYSTPFGRSRFVDGASFLALYSIIWTEYMYTMIFKIQCEERLLQELPQRDSVSMSTERPSYEAPAAEINWLCFSDLRLRRDKVY